MSDSLRQRSKPLLFSENDLENSVSPNDDFSKKKHPPLLNNKSWLFIFITYFSISLIVLYCDLVRFPSSSSIESLKTSENIQFSEERALIYVTELSSIGPKPAGSYENEVAAVNYIIQTLSYIKIHSKPVNTISIDIQAPSGCFPLTFMDGMTSCYSSVTNIIARIGPRLATNRSILINCHFDSTPTSPGASDNIVSCAVMFEVLFILSQQERALSNEVIFLFNGAEENFHQAAHGFITQHPWAKTVVGFINMDACGAGGKQMLFQSSRKKTWLLLSYAKDTPYPLGSVVSQDIFQNNLIPSDTDYRIFVEFGKLPGLDFAYVKNGYVYHTKHDIPESITAGSVQQAGLNLLNLIQNALESPDMTIVEDQSEGKYIFFDFLGLFLLVYRINIGIAINILITLLSFADMYYKCWVSGMNFKRRMFHTGKAFLVIVSSLIMACVSVIAVAFLLSCFNATMSWYKSPYITSGLYGSLSLAGVLTIHYFSCKKVLRLNERWFLEDVYFDAARLFWICLLTVMTFFQINSSFICTAWILFPTLIRTILSHFYSLVGLKGSRVSHLVTHILMHIVPLCLLIYCFWILYSVFIPILGRSGAVDNPDILVGILTATLVFSSTSYMVSLTYVMKSTDKVILFLLLIFSTTFAVVSLTPLGFPYSGDVKAPAPMRLYMIHTVRTFHQKNPNITSQDSGFWIIPLDYNGPRLVKTFIGGIEDLEPIDCEEHLACGMPFYIPVMSLIKITYYKPAPRPKIPDNRKFELVSILQKSFNSYSFHFFANGSDRMTVILSPRSGVKILKLPASNGTPLRNVDWKGRPTYFLYYAYGKYKEPWTFSIDIEVDINYKHLSPFIDLLFLTHYLHGPASVSDDFKYYLNQIPPWVDVVPWTSTLDSYIF